MLVTATTSEHIGHWIKMRRFLARFSGLESSVHTRYSADLIIATSAFRFSVHTKAGQDRLLVPRNGILYYWRRDPNTLVDVDSRAPFVRHSLKTDDLAKARSQRGDIG